MPPGRADLPAIPLVRTDQGEPTVSDRYELRSVLGSGGMGTVWEAYDRRLGRRVALKVLRDDLPPSAQARLEREARAAARISDPRVVTVLDLDRTRDGNPYLVLECHDGATLADELRRDGALSSERLDLLIDDLLGALAAAHERGVLHRDVKPANVLAGAKGFRVTDFGLASLDDDQTTETDLMGTLVYVAPERLEGARGSARSDVFSAAVVLYEAASGVQPFRADDPAESVARLRRGEAPRLPDHLPLALRTTLHRALSAEPSERPADAGEMLRLIRGGLDLDAEPTVVLDATSVLPAAGPDDPTEDVFARTRTTPPARDDERDDEPGDEPEPSRAATLSAPGVPATAVRPGSSVFAPGPPSEVEGAPAPSPAPPRPTLADRAQPVVDQLRRQPELLIAGVAAAILVALLLVVAVGDGGGADPAPASAAEQPQDLDGVLDRIEELGR